MGSVCLRYFFVVVFCLFLPYITSGVLWQSWGQEVSDTDFWFRDFFRNVSIAALHG